jgi:hypothetical protein
MVRGPGSTRRTGSAASGRVRAGAVGVAMGVVALALTAAGCGGASGGPKVAQIGTTTSSSSSSQSSSSSANPAKFSACMRKNGVTNFPDPDRQGRIRIAGGVRNGQRFGLDPNSAVFKKAMQACQKYAPQASPQQRQKEQQAALAFAKCMREHGVPKFPDPTFTPNGGTLMTFGKKAGLDPNSPQFQRARQACQKLVPGSPLAGGPPPRS